MCVPAAVVSESDGLFCACVECAGFYGRYRTFSWRLYAASGQCLQVCSMRETCAHAQRRDGALDHGVGP